MFRVLILALAVGLGSCASWDNCPHRLPRNNFLQALGNKCYHFSTVLELDYWKARLNCRNTGGMLALAKTRKVSNFLYYHLKYTYRTTGQYWIGLNDKTEENKFVWEDGSALHFSNFGAKEGPRTSYFQGKLEDCVAIDTNGGWWRDYRCGTKVSFLNPKKHFICEYNKTTPATTTEVPASVTEVTTAADGTDHGRCLTLDNCNLDCDNGLQVNAQGCAECKCAP